MFTTRQLLPPKWKQVIDCLEATDSFRRIEFSWSPLIKAETASYAFAETNRVDWPEDFYLMRDSQDLYLCFHSTDKQQIIQVVSLLTSCLTHLGIAGSFEEL